MVQKFLEEEAFEKGIILKWKEFEQTTWQTSKNML
jgi:hypothetical protein